MDSCLAREHAVGAGRVICGGGERNWSLGFKPGGNTVRSLELSIVIAFMVGGGWGRWAGLVGY